MQHFLEVVPAPSLIFLMPFHYFLPLKIILQLLMFSNSSYHQRGNFSHLIVQISWGVDPGSQNDTRIGEASVDRGFASKSRLTSGSLWVHFCKEA